MAPKSVTFRRHDHLVSVLFGDLLSHSYNITFSMFLYPVPHKLITTGVVISRNGKVFQCTQMTSCSIETVISQLRKRSG